MRKVRLVTRGWERVELQVTTVDLDEEEVAYLRGLLIDQDRIEPAQLEIIDNLLEKIQ